VKGKSNLVHLGTSKCVFIKEFKGDFDAQSVNGRSSKSNLPVPVSIDSCIDEKDFFIFHNAQ
jgi:hypothetical protein